MAASGCVDLSFPVPLDDAAVDPGDAIPRVGLVGHWKLDETDGTMSADSSGSDNHGRHVGGPTISSVVAPVSFSNLRSLSFARTSNQTASVVDSPTLSLVGTMSIAAWVRPTIEVVGSHGIVEKWENVNGVARRGYILRIGSNGSPSFGVANATSFTDTSGAKALPLGDWSHVAGVYDGSALRVYVNGTVQGTRAGVRPPTDGSSALEIGRAMGGNGFQGNIDDVRIYRHALSAAEVMNLASGGM